MIEENEVILAQEAVKKLLNSMAVEVLSLKLTPVKEDALLNKKDGINVEIVVQEPQILIGQQGQTLFEISRILQMILHKKLKKDFYIVLDINEYRKKKIEHIKNLAMEVADQAVSSKEPKILPSMSAYDRRIVHAELSERKDVITQSQGEGLDRYIVIKPL